MKRKIIPYRSDLKEKARELRNNMTFSEVLLWNELKQGKMYEMDFDRQKPILNYIVDFYCKDLKLAIEIDGSSHDDKIEDDQKRQKEITIKRVIFKKRQKTIVSPLFSRNFSKPSKTYPPLF